MAGTLWARHRVWLAAVLLVLIDVLPGQSVAQDHRVPSFSALARVSGPITVLFTGQRLDVAVPLTQPVPWRTRLMADPPRVLVDFRTVNWSGVEVGAITLEGVAQSIRLGDAGGGWSRLVLEMARPMGFAQAGMETDLETGTASLNLELVPLTAAEFAQQATSLASSDQNDRDRVLGAVDEYVPFGQRPTRVVLDPGHGGIDPGAVHENVTEADLMLTFTRELAEALLRTGNYEVVMTRNSDEFVSLEARITVAHSTHADVMVSLHADALEDGRAQGATVYTLSNEATDTASAALAERHDRDDLLGGGVDLAGADDSVAAVLMSLARTETTPATDNLALALVIALQGADLHIHRNPWQQAAFSVLKSATVPSVLLEVGFLSDERDRARLNDPVWRAVMAQAVITGLDAWVADEAAQVALRRR